MASDIMNQVVQEIKSSAFGLFSIQLDKSGTSIKDSSSSTR